MTEKLKQIEERYDELERMLGDAGVVSDVAQYTKISKEYKSLTPLVEKYRESERAKAELLSLSTLIAEETDADMRRMCMEEKASLEEKIARLSDEIKVLLMPSDPNDEKSVIIEIRAGAGGEEASLFSAVLYRMYSMYADKMGWKTEILNANETELGGYKEISFSVEGERAYSRLKFESGVHRVQRVPETEAQGRIQTSTATVAVLPEAEEVELEINPADLVIDTYRSGGAGGQHVNKTDSAIRITHVPTGTVVECQDERSQYKNKDKAMKLLRTRLYEAELMRRNEKIASERKSQVGTGDRSERIRTYNYPQSRLTDHRIGLTLHNLEDVLNGGLDPVIEALVTADTAEKLKASGE